MGSATCIISIPPSRQFFYLITTTWDQHPVHLQTPQITPKWSKQLQPSEVTPRSPEPSLSSRPPNPPQLPSHGISPETTLMPSVACTSINSVTTPTAAHPLVPTSTLTARLTVLLPMRPVMSVTWATSRLMDKATERAQPLTSSSSWSAQRVSLAELS